MHSEGSVEGSMRVLHNPYLILQRHVPINHLSPVDVGGVDHLQSPIPMSRGIPGTECRPWTCTQHHFPPDNQQPMRTFRSQHRVHTLPAASSTRYKVDWSLWVNVVVGSDCLVEDWPETLIAVLVGFKDYIHSSLVEHFLQSGGRCLSLTKTHGTKGTEVYILKVSSHLLHNIDTQKVIYTYIPSSDNRLWGGAVISVEVGAVHGAVTVGNDPRTLCSVGLSLGQVLLQPLQLLRDPPAGEIGVEIHLSGVAGEIERQQ